MNKDKYVFSQLTSLLDRSLFNDYVRKYHGDKYVKHFTCWNQLLVLMFGQLPVLPNFLFGSHEYQYLQCGKTTKCGDL